MIFILPQYEFAGLLRFIAGYIGIGLFIGSCMKINKTLFAVLLSALGAAGKTTDIKIVFVESFRRLVALEHSDASFIVGARRQERRPLSAASRRSTLTTITPFKWNGILRVMSLICLQSLEGSRRNQLNECLETVIRIAYMYVRYSQMSTN